MTKKQQQMLAQYNNSNSSQLWQVYNNYSIYKAQAMARCKELQKHYNGYNGKITSYNSQKFSYAFTYIDSKTQKPMLYYITASNSYQFCIA